MAAPAPDQPAQVAPGVVRLGTWAVNWYLLADGGGVTVIDAGAPGYKPQLEQGLEVLGRRPADIEAVLLTHGDLDHVGLAAHIKERAGCPVFLHPADDELVHEGKRKKTEAGMLSPLRHRAAWATFGHFTRQGVLRTPKVTDTQPLEPTDALDVPGRPRVVHVPGHTDGHVAFELRSHGAVFVGDALITRNPLTGSRGPQISSPAANISSAQALASLDTIETLAGDVVLVGHGDPYQGEPAAAVAQARSRGIG
jgi:glyoxylase-like metal-dependent hydrolase (beta-lactamase superfamily II)